MRQKSGKLFIIATPIGNLDDLSPRARQTLADVDLVAAEDTRHSGRLLSHIGVKKRLLALHDHNEEQAVRRVMMALESGQCVALISDAGTPLLSDPGYRLVQAAHQGGIAVSPIPGPSAITAALSAAGLPTDRFCFEGFLPARRAARRKALESLVHESRTLVFFESVHRVADVLDDMCHIFGEERLAFVGRELTKMHEQCVQETLGCLRDKVDDHSIVSKGEFVIAVGGSVDVAESSLDVDCLLAALATKLSAKDAARVAALATGLSRNVLYERLLKLK